MNQYTVELLKLKRGGDVMPPRNKKEFSPYKKWSWNDRGWCC